MGRFDVAQVQINIAGEQPFTLDANITTRSARPAEVITVVLGSLTVYVYDLAAAQGFATACRTASTFPPKDFPEIVTGANTAVGIDRNQIGLLLRVEGKPRPYRINGIGGGASPTGAPHIRMEIGRLVVRLHDHASMRSWTDAWAAVESTAQRLWPEVDAFDEAEAKDRQRIARTGRARTSHQNDTIG